MTKWDDRNRSGLAAMTGAGTFGMQALTEYAVLNTLARDVTAGLAKLGGWAAENWYITAGVLGVIIYFALRPKR